MEKEDTQEIIFNKSNTIKGYWSIEEREKFIEALFLYGKDWKKVCEYIKTRTIEQSRSHSQKYFFGLKKLFHQSENTSGDNFNNIRKWIKNYVKDNIIASVMKFHNNYENFKKKLQNFCMLIFKAVNKSKVDKKTIVVKCCCRPKISCDCSNGCCKTSTSEEIYFDYENIFEENLSGNNSLLNISKQEKENFKIREFSTISENNPNPKNILFNITHNLQTESEDLLNEINSTSKYEILPFDRVTHKQAQEYILNFESPNPYKESSLCKYNTDSIFDVNLLQDYFHISNTFTI